jgi:ATP phosphoribosyltransferase
VVNKMSKLKLVIPKGSLETGTLDLFKEANYVIKGDDRTYRPFINDPELSVKILRPQEIPTLVEQGAHDIGISGEDWIRESQADVEILTKLEYGHVKIVLAVPEAWKDVNSFSELLLKFINVDRPLRISTEYINTVTEYILKNEEYEKRFGDKKPLVITPWGKSGENSSVIIQLSFGATESKPPEDAEAIIDNTETGTTIRANNLKIIEKIGESEAVLLANKKSLKDPWKREKISDVLTLLQGVVDARKKLHIYMNVKEENVAQLLATLPALKRPTISPLAGVEGWVALNTVIPREQFIELIPKLRKLAQGLVVHIPRQVLSLEEIRKLNTLKSDE